MSLKMAEVGRLGGSTLRMFVVDAFTDEPFRGNPAAVCLVPREMDLGEHLMQTIAAEMNHSETAYIQHLSDDSDFSSSDKFKICWFTPTREVPLCGHATLASAAVLFFCYNNDSNTITFMSKSGPLLACRQGDSITLDFPLNTVEKFAKTEALPIIKEICDPVMITDVQYSQATKKLLLRLADSTTRETLEKLLPDPRALQASDTSNRIYGVIVTVKCTPDTVESSRKPYDFLSRYFAPWNGIPEDPVTGSAHTVLADYWQKQLNKTEFYARQCSKRGGDIRIKIVGGRVELTGSAKVVLEGVLKL